MDLNQKIDQLFDEWRMQYKKNENFVKDGIIDEEKFNNVPNKILFITKEPNDPKNEATDYRKWWNQELFLPFSYRIAEWGYGILNDFPPYNDLWPIINGKYDSAIAHDAIKSIAFMNVKKTGGGGSSNENEINHYIERDLKFIQKQIDIIKPEIIIMGMSWKSTVELLFPGVEWKPTGYMVEIAKYNNAKVIDYYHPSSRNSPAASYSLLQNVVKSKAFDIL